MKKSHSVRKRSSVLKSIKQMVFSLIESFESPQTRQFRRWKNIVSQ